MDKKMQKELLQRLLNQREKMVIAMRFGLAGAVPHTLEEIGSKLGITRERVRQIESKALAKMRRSPDMKELKVFLESDAEASTWHFFN